jgi:hypothetical protein
MLDDLAGGVLLQLVDPLQPDRPVTGWKQNQLPGLVAFVGVDLLQHSLSPRLMSLRLAQRGGFLHNLHVELSGDMACSEAWR